MILDAKGAKIVIADSDRAVLELIQIRLDLAGYHACVVRDGEALLEVLQNIRPAGLVIDAALNGMGAFAILEMLAEKGGVAFPILLMGRKLAAEDVRRAVSLGVRDCMAKPFSGADILERVTRLLRAPARPVQQVVKI